MPLVHKVTLTFGEDLQGKTMLQVWNLFQMYAAHNDCVPQGRLERDGRVLTLLVATKRRLGEPRDDHPAKNKTSTS